jgi:hypothetical protein
MDNSTLTVSGVLQAKDETRVLNEKSDLQLGDQGSLE